MAVIAISLFLLPSRTRQNVLINGGRLTGQFLRWLGQRWGWGLAAVVLIAVAVHLVNSNPELRSATNRWIEGRKSLGTQNVLLRCQSNEDLVRPIQGITKGGANVYELVGDDFLSSGQHVKPGTRVISVNGRTKTIDGIVMVQVRVRRPGTQDFMGGPVVWVKSMDFSWRQWQDNCPALSTT